MVNELAAVDGRAERVEFFLVARHDADGAVLVQIASQVADLQPAGILSFSIEKPEFYKDFLN